MEHYEDSFLDLLKEEHHTMREIERCNDIIQTYQTALNGNPDDPEYVNYIAEQLGKWYVERESLKCYLEKMRTLMREYIDKLPKGEE